VNGRLLPKNFPNSAESSGLSANRLKSLALPRGDGGALKKAR
jgi:hypothetical protein